MFSEIAKCVQMSIGAILVVFGIIILKLICHGHLVLSTGAWVQDNQEVLGFFNLMLIDSIFILLGMWMVGRNLNIND